MTDTMPTPSTDALLRRQWKEGDYKYVDSESELTDFARQLERELAVAMECLLQEGYIGMLTEIDAMRRKWEENK
jgi:hypothetical protein